MPKIGDRDKFEAQTVYCQADGGTPPFTQPQEKNCPGKGEGIPPEGWVIMGYEIVQHSQYGRAQVEVGYAPATIRTITTEIFDANVKGSGEYRWAEVWGKGDFKAKVNATRQKIKEYQKLDRRIVASGYAKGRGGNQGSAIHATVLGKIEYVGKPEDALLLVSQLVKEGQTIIMPTVYTFHEWHTTARNSRKAIISNEPYNYYFRANNKDGTTQDVMIHAGFLEMDPGVYAFKPSLAVESGSRQVTIEIQESKDNNIIGYKQEKITLTTSNAAFKVEFSKQKKETSLYVVVRWSDKLESDIILDNRYTFLEYLKSRD
ncbi:hypothetical protein JDS78_28890 [Bacillus cereus group sp. N17]|uniref:hypothetical protein n=1 Tax=Bacillus cereus group sp. N17 TaxID=2794589 RepID=UPI0018F59D84|nr:hypothetical protein [Bacillus cereus group sp. N17]MBJ8044200.1 hypothetical protein [Bacillus cereus group sp. N17]